MIDGPLTYPTARAAVEAMERQRGRCSAWTWTYRNTGGELVGVVLEWTRPDGTPMFRPASRMASGRWHLGAMPTPRPLYRLLELQNATHVYISASERAAFALAELRLRGTTNAGGHAAVGKTDWQPLAGKRCIILPTDDDTGRAYAEAVAAVLTRVRPAAVVRVVELPGLPAGGDVAAFVAARRKAGRSDGAIRAEIEALADGAKDRAPEPVRADAPRVCNPEKDRDDTGRSILRPREAAVALMISTPLLHRLTLAGTIPHDRIGRAVVYRVEELKRWLSEEVKK